MRRIISIIICLLFSVAVFTVQGSSEVFTEMYATLEKRDFYIEQKEKRIQELKQMLKIPAINPEQQYEIHSALFREYQSYITDSAIVYETKNMEIAKSLGSAVWQTESKLRLAALYSVAGMYIDALSLLESVHRHALPDNLRETYYGVYQALYEQYSYGNLNSQTVLREKSLYRDSLIAVLDTTSTHYKIACAEKLYDARQLDEALTMLLKIFHEQGEDTHEKAIVAYCIARIYRDKEKYDEAKEYCALSVIADTRNVIKENASLYMMANLFYDTGEMEHAYRFITLSLEDATFCNARFRSVQLSEISSIIDSAYKQMILDQRKHLYQYLAAICLLTFLLTLAVGYVYWQLWRIKESRKKLSGFNKQLNVLNTDLQNANCQLENANRCLLEANHVKETYIGHFLNLCSSYIDKLEEYRRSLNKSAATQKIEDLFRKLKSTEFIDRELKELYHNFDKIFVGLYPDFVKDVNQLLLPDEQFVLKANELLPPELRVYALIRLGITDNTQIAAFLRYSMSTVYNYRTKVRNKAAVPRDDFEEMVMNIGEFKK